MKKANPIVIGKVFRYLADPLAETITSLALLATSVIVESTATVLGRMLPPSLWFQSTVGAIEVASFLVTLCLVSSFVLRAVRLLRREFEKTFK